MIQQPDFINNYQSREKGPLTEENDRGKTGDHHTSRHVDSCVFHNIIPLFGDAKFGGNSSIRFRGHGLTLSLLFFYFFVSDNERTTRSSFGRPIYTYSIYLYIIIYIYHTIVISFLRHIGKTKPVPEYCGNSGYV